MKWNQSNMNRARDDVHMGVPAPLLVFLRVVVSIRPDWEQVHVLAETSRWIEEAPNIQYFGDVNRFSRSGKELAAARAFYIRQERSRDRRTFYPFEWLSHFNNAQRYVHVKGNGTAFSVLIPRALTFLLFSLVLNT